MYKGFNLSGVFTLKYKHASKKPFSLALYKLMFPFPFWKIFIRLSRYLMPFSFIHQVLISLSGALLFAGYSITCIYLIIVLSLNLDILSYLHNIDSKNLLRGYHLTPYSSVISSITFSPIKTLSIVNLSIIITVIILSYCFILVKLILTILVINGIM